MVIHSHLGHLRVKPESRVPDPEELLKIRIAASYLNG